MTGLEIRRATHDDYEGVVAITSELWADRGGDYLPRVYHDWLEDDDEVDRKTFVAEVDGAVAGIVQGVFLSADEAWFQGMRVDPAVRRHGVSRRLTEAGFDWARGRGATVARNMIFSWNVAGLGAARASGFEPVTEFRWAHPEPDPGAESPLEVAADPSAAWRYWTESDARTHLGGLGIDLEESWAMRELTRDDLHRVADETAVFAVLGEGGVSGMSYRSREYDRENDEGDLETWAEYGVGAWKDLESAESLLAAVARDAAALGADRTRVLIPETAGTVSDAVYAGGEVSAHGDFVLGADLTTR